MLDQLKIIKWNFVLFLLLGAGLFFRIFNLPSRELFFTDGLVYWNMAKLADQGIFHFYQGKPGHIFLLWIAGTFLGWGWETPILVSVMFGILSLGMVYLIGEHFFSKGTGLWASALLAVSPWHLFYSRTSGASANSIYFFLAGLYFYLKSRPDGKTPTRKPDSFQEEINNQTFLALVLSGLFVGFAFTCHYNLGIMPFIFLVFEFHLLGGLWFWRGKGTKDGEKLKFSLFSCWVGYTLKRVFVLFTAMFLPLGFFDFFHIYLFYRSKGELVFEPSRIENLDVISSYFQQVFIQLRTSTHQIWGKPVDLEFIQNLFFNNLGWLSYLLLTAGVVYIFWNLMKSFWIGYLVLLLPLLVYLVFMLLTQYTGAGRTVAFGIPLIVLVAGQFCSRVALRLWGHWTASLICLLIFVNDFPLLKSFCQYRTQNEQIDRYLKKEQIREIGTIGDKARQATSDPLYLISHWKTLSSFVEQGWSGELESVRLPSYFLVDFVNADFLKNSYKCVQVNQWTSFKGRSLLYFESGDVKRIWDLSQEKETKLTSLVLLKNCRL